MNSRNDPAWLPLRRDWPRRKQPMVRCTCFQKNNGDVLRRPIALADGLMKVCALRVTLKSTIRNVERALLGRLSQLGLHPRHMYSCAFGSLDGPSLWLHAVRPVAERLHVRLHTTCIATCIGRTELLGGWAFALQTLPLQAETSVDYRRRGVSKMWQPRLMGGFRKKSPLGRPRPGHTSGLRSQQG